MQMQHKRNRSIGNQNKRAKANHLYQHLPEPIHYLAGNRSSDPSSSSSSNSSDKRSNSSSASISSVVASVGSSSVGVGGLSSASDCLQSHNDQKKNKKNKQNNNKKKSSKGSTTSVACSRNSAGSCTATSGGVESALALASAAAATVVDRSSLSRKVNLVAPASKGTRTISASSGAITDQSSNTDTSLVAHLEGTICGSLHSSRAASEQHEQRQVVAVESRSASSKQQQTLATMPTSNQQTDTNNNSKNKIATNGRPSLADIHSSNTQSGGSTNSNMATTELLQPARESQLRGEQDSYIPTIKFDQQQQHHQNQQHQHQLHLNQQQQQVQQNSHNTFNTSQQQQAQQPSRTIEELMHLIKDINFERSSLSNEELIKLVKNQHISIYKLESFLGKDNAARCVEVRRDFYRLELSELDKIDPRGIADRHQAFSHPRYEDLDYEKVNGACCENVIGHVKVPVGVAGPLVLDGEEIFVPLATTEGCLVASTCRGLSALRKSGGVTSRVRKDFMTRAPIVRFQDTRLMDALDNVERAINWLNDEHNKEKMKMAFNLTSSHGKFLNYTLYPVSREIHIRFEAQTGDAMGMNMCSKGVESALKEMQRAFPSMEIVTLSGNMCTDKKAAGINWINGRGKSVECNAELPAHVVQQVFKVSVDSMIDRWKSKVMVGSALAASIGGFNSQAANILTAIFIATGQDPAQNVTSSNCMSTLR